jgi:hypothetical protein
MDDLIDGDPLHHLLTVGAGIDVAMGTPLVAAITQVYLQSFQPGTP